MQFLYMINFTVQILIDGDIEAPNFNSFLFLVVLNYYKINYCAFLTKFNTFIFSIYLNNKIHTIMDKAIISFPGFDLTIWII
jgi:hypothetical protein